MQKSQTANQTWSFHTSDSGNSNNLWPELCQMNQVKCSVRKKEPTDTEEKIMNLDDSEYPELSSSIIGNKNCLTLKKQYLSKSTIEIFTPIQLNMEPKRPKRFKRTDKICINLQEALQDTRCTNKINNRALPKFRINIYKGIPGITSSNIVDKNKICNLKKVRICISKDKKPSKLKRIILLNRDIRAHINMQKREAFEREKMQAICQDVDSINFNALKITADPEIDLNYVKRMCTMTLYGKDYGSRNVEHIPESSVYHRPDVIKKLNNLCIQGKCMSNKVVENSNAQTTYQICDDIVENVIKRTFSLDIKEDIKQDIKQEIKDEPMSNTESDITNFVIHSRNFREYCTNMLTPSLTNSLEILLREIKRLQKRLHEKNPNKSRYKRRYYAGLKEVRKHVELKKVKFVIIAPDLEKVELEGGLDDQVDKLLEACRMQNVIYCFALGRRKLGYYSHGKGLVGCIGVANYSGAEELFKNVLRELLHARNAFKQLSGARNAIIDLSKLISDDYLLSENITTLINVLSPNYIHCNVHS
ncbi:uncharacterized protein LOC143346290 [Colletes latitarsis]|uniref:uncharacterized protein LOC143346290 n=1 Tax=Colletes latitarsis TaxID=2605962 RepID=UPI004036BCCF